VDCRAAGFRSWIAAESERRTAVAFHFQKASCVVVGTFNMYILHPEWLARHEIIERGMEVGIETNLAQPGFRFQFSKLKAVWSVAPNRVVIETRDAQMDCGALVGKVLDALPHTPLFGLGNNAVYEADLSEMQALAPAVHHFPWPKSPNEGETVAQKTFHVAVKRAEHEVTNLQMALTEKTIELSCNVHTELKDRAAASAVAVAAAKRFFEDRTYSKTLAQHFFGTSIHHGSNNP
jgi:hypothetical protein